jgi:hypothetical protein
MENFRDHLVADLAVISSSLVIIGIGVVASFREGKWLLAAHCENRGS